LASTNIGVLQGAPWRTKASEPHLSHPGRYYEKRKLGAGQFPLSIAMVPKAGFDRRGSGGHALPRGSRQL